MINLPTGCILADIQSLKPYEKNPKNHNDKDINLIIKSIKRNGWGDPLLVCPETMEVLSGNGRLMAAQKLDMEQVPVVYAPKGLTEKQKADLVIASNKLVEISGYNNNLDLLLEEFELNAEDFGIDLAEDKPRMPKEAEIPEGYEVVVECESEEEQQQVFEDLTEKGYKCRVLTL
jgi:ParB-like chromosome segregation protein Spo0J